MCILNYLINIKMATTLDVSKSESCVQNEMPNTIESMINQLFIKEDNIDDNSSSSETEIKLEDFNEDEYDLQTEDTETQQSFTFRPKGDTKWQTVKGNNTFFEKNYNDFMFNRVDNRKIYKTTCVNNTNIISNTTNNIVSGDRTAIDMFNNNNNLWLSNHHHQMNNQTNINTYSNNNNNNNFKSNFKVNNNHKRNHRHKITFEISNKNANELHNCILNINNNNNINNTYQSETEWLIYEIETQLTSPNRYTYYQTILPSFIKVIKTQSGSRILQTYLTQTSPSIISTIYELISSYIKTLLFDPYANYFCLKLFYCLSPTERLSYLNHISSSIPSLSINKVATYPIQCIIANLATHQEKELLMEVINTNIDKLSFDIYGTHVVEKALICLEPIYTKSTIQIILDNFLMLSSHVNGLCIAKRILLLSTQTGLYRNELIYILNKYCISLIQNPYGNYALQVVIEQWDENSIISVISPLTSHIAELSLMKYSSNVIERCLEKSPIFLRQFIQEVCGTPGVIGQLIKNSYGNYVVQTALRISSNEHKVRLINNIEENLNVLEEKKLINKWKSILAANIFECVSKNNNYVNQF